MIHPSLSRAAIQQTDSPTITLRTTTTLVFLDITVLDKQGRPAFSFIRDSASKYLAALPAQLLAPTRLMVLSNQSLDMVQGYARSRADLLSALDRIPRKLPFKIFREWGGERLSQSIEALQQIALQNKNVSAKKNMIWR